MLPDTEKKSGMSIDNYPISVLFWLGSGMDKADLWSTLTRGQSILLIC